MIFQHNQLGEDVNLQNPKVLQALQQFRIEDLKTKILQDNGLDKFEDPANKILQFATQKYSKENTDNFAFKIRQLEQSQQMTMELIFKNPDLTENEILQSMDNGMGKPNVQKENLSEKVEQPNGQQDQNDDLGVSQELPAEQKQQPTEEQSENPQQNDQVVEESLQVEQSQEESQNQDILQSEVLQENAENDEVQESTEIINDNQ